MYLVAPVCLSVCLCYILAYTTCYLSNQEDAGKSPTVIQQVFLLYTHEMYYGLTHLGTKVIKV